MSLIWWPAPAKLNLGLRVVGRRPDGYHELQTVFQIIDLVRVPTFTCWQLRTGVALVAGLNPTSHDTS